MELKSLPRVDTPDATWQLACQYIQDKRAVSRRPEDALLRVCCHFIHRMNLSTDYITLQRDYPDFYRAYNLYHDITTVKWLLEASLLTSASFADIADYFGESPGVVDIFSKVFYNVRPRLGARGFILNEIMKPAVRRGIADRDYDALYKILGYAGGWEILKDYLEYKELNPNTAQWLTGANRAQMQKLGFKAMQRIEINQFNAVEIIGKWLEFEQLEREQGAGPAQSEADAMMKSLLGSCNLTIMSSKATFNADEPRVGDLVKGVAPLKYREPVLIEAGGENGKT